MRNMEKKSIPSPQNSSSDHAVESQVFILFLTNDVRNTIKSMEVLDLQFGEQLIDMYTPYVVMISVIQSSHQFPIVDQWQTS